MSEKLLDLNNYWKITKSQKIKRSDYIIDMIAEMIDNNQYIKRFMRYYSENPLAKRGTLKNNKKINQPNLNDSLMKDTLEVDSPNENTESKRCLFTWGFNDNLNVDEQNYIFIENHRINYDNNNKMATMYINISILIPDTYLELKDSESEHVIRRNKIIADTIDNMLGEYTVDNKYSKLLGNIQFELTDYSEGRLSNNNNKIISVLTYKTTYNTGRVMNVGI